MLDEEMDAFERGWSSRIDRKIKRFLARSIVNKTFKLPPRSIVASFTFDDAPDNAESEGAQLLASYGVHGTFYISAALAGRQDALWRVLDRRQIKNLSRSGHEIACHTADHVNVQSLDAASLLEQCRRNRALFFEICGEIPIENFAYPFGDLGWRQKRILQPYFDTCRTIYERPARGLVDLGALPAIALLDAKIDGAGVERLLNENNENKEQGCWLIFYTHDVSNHPTPIGSSIGLLKETIELLKAKNIPILTIGQALRHFGRQRSEPLLELGPLS